MNSAHEMPSAGVSKLHSSLQLFILYQKNADDRRFYPILYQKKKLTEKKIDKFKKNE